jgi:hypothetical protein
MSHEESMKTQVAKNRIDIKTDEPIQGWAANKLPTYQHLKLVLDEMAKLDRDGVAEIGADYNDSEADGLSIVWANYAYFTDGDGSLRDMYGWVAVDLTGEHYFGCNLDGEEFIVPFSDPSAAEIAATKTTHDPY